MNENEMRLAQLLRTATPEPPSEVSLDTLRVHDVPLALVESPDRSPVRRRAPFIAAAAVAATVAAAVVGIAVANHHGTPNAPAGSNGPLPSAVSSPSGVAPATIACPSSQLSGSVIGHDSGSSHNLAVIGVRNTGATSCFVQGYADVVPFGASGLITATQADGTSLLADPGSHQITLAPGALASFGVEATTGFDGPTTTITLLKIYPSDGTDSFPVDVELSSSGTPVQLGLTAFQLGAPPASSSTASSTAPSSPAASVQTAACDANELSVAAGRVDSGAGQRNVTITITNSSGAPCTVGGFPQNLIANSSSAGDSGSQLSITTTNSTGSPATVVLAKGASASFVFHTTTGYDGAQVTIALLRFGLAGSPGQITLLIPNGGIAANGPSGQPIPVTVSALQAAG
jgi:hypothetical protein